MIISLEPSDFAVIAAYLIALVGSGFMFRKHSSSARDYFVGGGQMSWPLAALSCFMMSFSAWTFTGAAGFAYQYGFVLLAAFLGNAAGFVFAGIFVAPKARQSECVTPLEIVRNRYGRLAEQFFTWVQIPMFLFNGSIWIAGFGIFASVAFNVPVELIIVFSSLVVILYSSLGGSLAIVAYDSFQSVILIILVSLISVLCLFKMGGVDGMLEKLPPEILFRTDETVNPAWIIGIFLISFLNFSAFAGTARYLSVPSGKDARKVAFMAATLFVVGPVFWFIPPIAAGFYFPDIAKTAPGLVNPEEAAYLVMGFDVLPSGLAGLLVMIVFGATLSTMDTALNQNSAFFTVNFYQRIIRKNATPRELYRVGQVINLVFGLTVILISLNVVAGTRYSLFDLNVLLISIVSVPLAITVIFIFIWKWSPRWSGMVTLLSALSASLVFHLPNLFPVNWKTLEKFPYNMAPETWIAGDSLTIFVRALGTILVGILAFFATTLFWKRCDPKSRESILGFQQKIRTPVPRADTPNRNAPVQLTYTGILLMFFGAVLLATLVFPEVRAGKPAINVGFGLILIIAGLSAIYLAKKKTSPDLEETSKSQTKT